VIGCCAFRVARPHAYAYLLVMDAIEGEVSKFRNGPWGLATASQEGARGLCKRATLAFLAQLEPAGLADGVRLWRLDGALVDGSGAGTHWVLAIGDEMIDVTARQFDPGREQIERGSLKAEIAKWQEAEEVDPDSTEQWGGGFLKLWVIPPWWRELKDAEPPGDLREWPYPRENLGPNSPWHDPVT
jgi:hypothetical protein